VVFTVTFAVTGALPVTCTELAEQEAPIMAGGTVQAKLTVPANPLAAMTFTGMVAVWPAAEIVVDADDGGTTVKSAVTTVMVICTEGAAR
jgi:hypothetical protein